MLNYYFFAATHDGYTSDRKLHHLGTENILGDLRETCGCARQCTKLLQPELVMRWRKKVHLLVQGYSQQTRLLQLYHETLFHDQVNKTVHVVEGQLICKYVFFI